METTSPKHPKFVRWAVLIGIVIALNLFFWVGRSLVIPEPKFEDYCPQQTTQALTEDSCVAQNGTWIAYPEADLRAAPTKPDYTGYCDYFQKCQPEYDAAWKEHQMYAFAIMVGLGVLSLIAGVLPIGSSIVSSGLSYGGVLALIIAALSYWGEAGNLLRLGISFIALVALIYLGIRRFKD